jgi:hypothetical protein
MHADWHGVRQEANEHQRALRQKADQWRLSQQVSKAGGSMAGDLVHAARGTWGRSTAAASRALDAVQALTARPPKPQEDCS